MIIKRVTDKIIIDGKPGSISPGSGTGGLTKETGIETDPGFIWPEL